MPYWVAQKRGPHVGRIEEIVSGWRHGLITDREAWQELAELYRVINGHYPNGENGQEIPPDRSYELHRDGFGSDVEYMLSTWFPLYANVWYAGWREDCHDKARSLGHWIRGTRFEVCYEY